MAGAGRMRDRVGIQAAALLYDETGQESEVWTTVGTYWAEVEFVRGLKVNYNGQVFDQVSHVVTTRWFGPLDPAQRILFDGRQLSILGIDDVERLHREYRIHCQELVGVTS
jgi:SPP1 family predicted phage head-tail adaptor